MESRLRGMMYGHALGDALGTPHELKFSTKLDQYTGELIYRPIIGSKYQGIRSAVVGQVSDDTEMSLALANSIIDHQGYDRDATILMYLDWANSKPYGMGKNTRSLFAGVRTIKGYLNRYAKMNRNHQSNGSLMRIAPMVVMIDLHNHSSFNLVIQDTRITNPNQVNEQITILYLLILRMALDGGSVDDIIRHLQEITNLDPEIKVVLEQGLGEKTRDIITNKGWVVHAFYCVILSLRWFEATPSYRLSIIDRIIRLGGDVDTNAAIVGAVIGLLVGIENLEKEESSNLSILRGADSSQGDFPRPSTYHPVSIDRLIDDLVKLI